MFTPVCIFILFSYLVWIMSTVNFLKSGTLQFWTWFCCLRHIFGIITDVFRCRALAWHAHWLPNNCHWDEFVASDELLTVSETLGRSPKMCQPWDSHLYKLPVFPSQLSPNFGFQCRQNIANITSRACLGLYGTISISAILECDTNDRLVNAVSVPRL